MFWTCFVFSMVSVPVYFFLVPDMLADWWPATISGGGAMKIHGYGLYLGEPYDIEMLKPYGVEYRHVAGCLVNGFSYRTVLPRIIVQCSKR